LGIDALETNERYSRQVLFQEIGAEGQKKLAQSRVLIVGCGATGSALASLLARSGVGTLRILDRDYVEPSNLQRQTLFDENDARESLPKAIAAARQIARFNSQIVVEPHVADLVPANVDSLLGGSDLILDGTDNFETRYLINDYAVKNSVVWIYAAAVASYAVTMNILPAETACLACIFPESPRGTVETCETAGILNSAVNLVASIAATEALKFLRVQKCAGRCFPGTSGRTNGRNWRQFIHGRDVAPARGTLFIWRVQDGRTLPCAEGIPCRFTSGNAPWTLPNSACASSLSATFATTNLC
jgi:adenylyltransferase/sulfurtransferase